jgi:predicted TIM-barrel fold metal-dependent hydrolase
MLADFPNLFGDLSANSGRNALARDPGFTADFLKRHQNKLMFGSDCSCADGNGAGQHSKQPLIAGKCVARETLAALKQAASPAVFRKLVWVNAVKLLNLDF